MRACRCSPRACWPCCCCKPCWAAFRPPARTPNRLDRADRRADVHPLWRPAGGPRRGQGSAQSRPPPLILKMPDPLLFFSMNGESHMARSVNKVILLGNVGKDPEIRSTPSGVMVANFGLATSDRQKDAQGNWQDRTEWHNLVAFNRTAEIVRDYVKKGSKLYIEGKIQPTAGTTRRPSRSAIAPRSSSMIWCCSPAAKKAAAARAATAGRPALRLGGQLRPAPAGSRRRAGRIRPAGRDLRRRYTVLGLDSGGGRQDRTADLRVMNPSL